MAEEEKDSPPTAVHTIFKKDGEMLLVPDFPASRKLLDERLEKLGDRFKEQEEFYAKNPDKRNSIDLDVIKGTEERIRHTQTALTLVEESLRPEGITASQRNSLREALKGAGMAYLMPSEEALQNEISADGSWHNRHRGSAVTLMSLANLYQYENAADDRPFFAQTGGGQFTGFTSRISGIVFSKDLEHIETKTTLEGKLLGDAVKIFDSVQLGDVERSPNLQDRIRGERAWAEISADDKQRLLDDYKLARKESAQQIADTLNKGWHEGFREFTDSTDAFGQYSALRADIALCEDAASEQAAKIKAQSRSSWKDAPQEQRLNAFMPSPEELIINASNLSLGTDLLALPARDKAADLYETSPTGKKTIVAADQALQEAKAQDGLDRPGSMFRTLKGDEYDRLLALADERSESGLYFRPFILENTPMPVALDPTTQGESYVTLQFRRGSGYGMSENCPTEKLDQFSKATGLPILMFAPLNTGDSPLENTDFALIRTSDLEKVPVEKITGAMPIIASYVEDNSFGFSGSRASNFQENSRGISELTELYAASKIRKPDENNIFDAGSPRIDETNAQINSGQIKNKQECVNRLSLLRDYCAEHPEFAAKAQNDFEDMMKDIEGPARAIYTKRDDKTLSITETLDRMIEVIENPDQHGAQTKADGSIQPTPATIYIPIISIINKTAREEIEAIGENTYREMTSPKAAEPQEKIEGEQKEGAQQEGPKQPPQLDEKMSAALKQWEQERNQPLPKELGSNTSLPKLAAVQRGSTPDFC